MKWFTSDLHFGHAGVITYCKRPFLDLNEMHDVLIQRWNSCVQAQDEVYVCGDLALCRYRDFVPVAQQLNGIKYLIRGNHDKYSDGQYERLGFKVFTEVQMKLAGHVVRLSHFPYALPWYRRPFAYASELRFMDKRPPRMPNEFLIHGHTHTKYRESGNRIHVGVDAWAYAPVSAPEIESILGSKTRK